MGNLGHDFTRSKLVDILTRLVKKNNEEVRRIADANKTVYSTASNETPDNLRNTAPISNQEEIPAAPIRYSIQGFTDNNTLWQHVMSQTIFNLAPRGFGRASFRLAEIIQIGRIPVYVYDDIPWIPYPGSPAGCDALGIVLKCTEGPSRVCENCEHSYCKPSKISAMMNALERFRSEYTYKGVIRQLELFFRDPPTPLV